MYYSRSNHSFFSDANIWKEIVILDSELGIEGVEMQANPITRIFSAIVLSLPTR